MSREGGLFPDLTSLFVGEGASLRTAMSIFDEHAVRCDGSGIALVVDHDRHLLGLITDGDVRRALLSGESLDSPVRSAMAASPTVASVDSSAHQILRCFDRKIRHLPLVDSEGRVRDLLLYRGFTSGAREEPRVLRAKTPVRVSFAGGGTDFTDFFFRGPSAVMSATIDRYCHGTLMRRDDEQIIIRSVDYDREVSVPSLDDLEYDGTLDLVKAVIRLCRPKHGFELTIRSDVPPGSGLGSSASLAVTVIGLLNELAGVHSTEYQVADLAYQAERVELSIVGGWQDQYAAAFGGFNFIEFDDQEILVHQLSLSESVILELEESLLLCFTGITRNSGELHRSRLLAPSPSSATSQCQQAFQLATSVKKALLRGRHQEFGALLSDAWNWKKASGKVTNGRIEELLDAGLGAGATAGKLLGAGLGGHLLFHCSSGNRRMVAQSLVELGASVVDFSFTQRGLRVWHAQE